MIEILKEFVVRRKKDISLLKTAHIIYINKKELYSITMFQIINSLALSRAINV